MRKKKIISCLLAACLLCAAAACSSQPAENQTDDTARLTTSVPESGTSSKPAGSSRESAASEEKGAQSTVPSVSSGSAGRHTSTPSTASRPTLPGFVATAPGGTEVNNRPTVPAGRPADSAEQPAASDTRQPDPAPSQDTQSQDEQTDDRPSNDPPAVEIPVPANLTPDDIFAANLLTRQYRKGQNLFLSPLSIQQALGMAASGASGSTLDGILQAAGYASPQELQSRSETYNQLLETTPGYFTLANGIWLDENFADTVNPDFLAVNQGLYQADVFVEPLNGTAEGHINQWVSQKTDGLIPSIVNGLSPESRMVLVNTLLFDGEWAHSFDPDKTYTSTFHGAGGDIRLQFMRQKFFDHSWYESEDWYGMGSLQATLLDYDDGRTAMLLALPENLDSFMQQLTPAALHLLLEDAGQPSDKIVEVVMPRFTLSYDAGSSLPDVLTDMGMKDAFSLGTANFDSISSQPLAIGQIVHKAVLQVGERGTVAAASTGVDLPGSPPPVYPDVTLTLNRPFFCAILDKETGAIYFAGAVCQPEAY